MRIEISACFCQSWIFKLKGRGHRQSQAKDIQLSWDSSLDLLVIRGIWKVVLHNLIFFLVIHLSGTGKKSKFAEPLFSNLQKRWFIV